MSRWIIRLQFRSTTPPVIFSVNDWPPLTDGAEKAYFEKFIGRHLKAIAAPADWNATQGMTYALAACMQIRGPGMALRRT
jgi:hypothetical protein